MLAMVLEAAEAGPLRSSRLVVGLEAAHIVGDGDGEWGVLWRA